MEIKSHSPSANRAAGVGNWVVGNAVFKTLPTNPCLPLLTPTTYCPMIKIENPTKKFGDYKAIDSLTWR